LFQCQCSGTFDLDPYTSNEEEEGAVDGTPAEQSSVLTPKKLVKSANTLEDVVIAPDVDKDGNDVTDDNGVRVMIATTIKGIAIKKITMDTLRTFCRKFGIKPPKKSKEVLAREIAFSKQMDSAHELTGVAAKQSSQERIAMKIRLLNACFTDEHFQDFLNVNKRKTKNELDRGDAGNSKHFYVKISDMASLRSMRQNGHAD
jgi:hypothetical protein